MIKQIFASLSIVFLCTSCMAMPLRSMKFTARVTDSETEAPIANAPVETIFLYGYNGSPRQKGRRITQTDENGMITISEKTDLISANAFVSLDGYYSGRNGFSFKRLNKVLNRWEPWNPTIEVKMRKKNNPVPMTYKQQDWTVVPEFGKHIGYDLEIGDWVAPHGKGKIKDFLFTMNVNRKSMADAEASYTLTFLNSLDGIQEYLPAEGLQSSFIFPYLALTNGYKESLYQHDITTPYSSSKTTEKKNINYIFRVRTKMDSEGNIASTCYGRIKGELKISRKGQVEFEYWFNPVPNERSLEYSGKNLLKK